MREFLHRKLTNSELQAREDMRYEGRIVRVEPHRVFNKFKFTTKEIVPVIFFEDGWSGFRTSAPGGRLMERWSETDDWIPPLYGYLLEGRDADGEGVWSSGRAHGKARGAASDDAIL